MILRTATTGEPTPTVWMGRGLRWHRLLRHSLFVASIACLAACGQTQRASTTATTSVATTKGTAAVSAAAATATSARSSSTSAARQRPTPASPPRSRAVARLPEPRIVWDPIPFGPGRRREMAAYAERHYGLHTYKLIDPHVIVIHYTDGPSFASAFDTFAADTPDIELHELPGTCSHFVIDGAGVIRQLVSLSIMCRHTVGLNWTTIGIEHVGYSDRQILENPRQLDASLKLVRWLRCRLRIRIANVIGHNESLSSPYHHERVPSLRTQTHDDWTHADMQVYRRRLRALGACPAPSPRG